MSRSQKVDRSRLAAAGVVALLASGNSTLFAQAGMQPSAKAKRAIPTEELSERQTFIKKAMEEHRDRTMEAAAEMAKRGAHPIMVVTTLTPFADWDYYYVDRGTVRWSPNPGQYYEEVSVPSGFVTDLASIPRYFWQILPPQGRYAFAAVVHDYLYWTQTRPRKDADEIFWLAMEDSKVERLTMEAIFQAVRSPFGQAAWDNNAALKKAGERRFLKRFPTTYPTSWADWKKQPDVFQD